MVRKRHAGGMGMAGRKKTFVAKETAVVSIPDYKFVIKPIPLKWFSRVVNNITVLKNEFIDGSVPFAENAVITVDNDNFRYDNVNNRLKVDSLVLDKTAGKGIKVDKAAPTFGFADILGPVRKRGVGATDPGDAVYRDSLRAFQFAVNDEVWHDFHIPHDYVPGTDLFLHCHWSHILTTVTGGTVDWSFEMSYSKGHDQAVFPASVTTVVQGAASTTQYRHIISEEQASISGGSATQIDSDLLEPDGVIMVRAFLSANAIAVSGGPVPDPFCHFFDMHYQTTGVIGTKQKAPDFYT